MHEETWCTIAQSPYSKLPAATGNSAARTGQADGRNRDLSRCASHHRFRMVATVPTGGRGGAQAATEGGGSDREVVVRLKSCLTLHCSHEWSTKLPQRELFSFFENDRLSLTSRETRCLKVLFNRSTWLVRSVPLPTARWCLAGITVL